MVKLLKQYRATRKITPKPFARGVKHFWSKVKNTIGSIGARTYKALDLAITQAYFQVSLKDIHNWFVMIRTWREAELLL